MTVKEASMDMIVESPAAGEWIAYRDGDSRVGWGKTPDEARADLLRVEAE